MKRRDLIKTTVLASLASASARRLFGQEASLSPQTPISVPVNFTPPVLQNVSPTGATVFWSVNRPATGWIEYGETEALGRSARGEMDGLLPFDPRVLRIRLEGLQPGRRYFYRTHTVPVHFETAYKIHRGDPVAGPIHGFSTLDPARNSASFVVWNDTHQNNTTLAGLVEHLPHYPADFLVWNGDIFNDVTTEDMLIRETLHPAGLEYSATRPLFLSRGNHDVRGAAARLLGRTMEAPGGKYYYTFRQGPVAFLVLDTGEDKDDGHQEYGGLNDFASLRTEQQAWLPKALAQPEFQSAPFRVLFTHIPLRERSSSADSRAKWESLLARARIDFAISGHTHRYAYNEPTDAQPFPLLVGGGPQPDRATFIHGEATPDKLRVRMFGLDKRDLGQWEIKRQT
jgi:hypothetical protein